jgi:hypothetical protein
MQSGCLLLPTGKKDWEPGKKHGKSGRTLGEKTKGTWERIRDTLYAGFWERMRAKEKFEVIYYWHKKIVAKQKEARKQNTLFFSTGDIGKI